MQPIIDSTILRRLIVQSYVKFILMYAIILQTPQNITQQIESFKKDIVSTLRDEILTLLDRVKVLLFGGKIAANSEKN